MSIPSRAHGDGRQSGRGFPSECVFRLCEIQISSREACFCSSSQARGNAREILNAASAVVLHGVERAVGCAKKFLGCVAILRKSSDPCANRKRRALWFSRESLADSSDNTRRDVLAGFWQYHCEFIATVSRVHVEKHHAEWALRAARTVKLRFENADEAPVIRQPREWVGNGHRAYLLEEASLIQQRAGKHDHIAACLAQFRQKKRAIEELPRKCRRCMADNIERGHDKERLIEEAGGALLVFVVLEPLAKTDRGDQEQRCGKQIPGTREQVRSMRDGRGGCGQKCGARHIGSQGNDQQPCGSFLAGLPRGWHVALDYDGSE